MEDNACRNQRTRSIALALVCGMGTYAKVSILPAVGLIQSSKDFFPLQPYQFVLAKYALASIFLPVINMKNHQETKVKRKLGESFPGVYNIHIYLLFSL